VIVGRDRGGDIVRRSRHSRNLKELDDQKAPSGTRCNTLLNDLGRKVANLFKLTCERLHLLPRLIGVKLHRLAYVLALCQLECKREVRFGIAARDLDDLLVE